MGTWNYRLMAHEIVGEIYLSIHGVFYDDKGTPKGYTEGMCNNLGCTVKEAKWTLNKMEEAFNKPILYYGNKFPKEYIPE